MNSKAWQTMNSLDEVANKICSAREIIDAAVDAIQHNNYNRAETLATAACEFLGYYLDEFDKKFQDAWKETVYPQNKMTDKVVKWQLPIELDVASGEFFVSFPDDLLYAANLSEGDQVDWIDNGDGSYTLKKVVE